MSLSIESLHFVTVFSPLIACLPQYEVGADAAQSTSLQHSLSSQSMNLSPSSSIPLAQRAAVFSPVALVEPPLPPVPIFLPQYDVGAEVLQSTTVQQPLSSQSVYLSMSLSTPSVHFATVFSAFSACLPQYDVGLLAQSTSLQHSLSSQSANLSPSLSMPSVHSVTVFSPVALVEPPLPPEPLFAQYDVGALTLQSTTEQQSLSSQSMNLSPSLSSMSPQSSAVFSPPPDVPPAPPPDVVPPVPLVVLPPDALPPEPPDVLPPDDEPAVPVPGSLAGSSERVPQATKKLAEASETRRLARRVRFMGCAS